MKWSISLQLSTDHPQQRKRIKVLEIRDERDNLQCFATLLTLSDANDVVSAESGILAHASEYGVGLVEQDERVVDLDDFSSVHDDDPVVERNGGEPAGQGEQSDQSEVDCQRRRCREEVTLTVRCTEASCP